jgi:ElaB/YqjD/DUF883 family membrane-anchored ribosome-binding protein
MADFTPEEHASIEAKANVNAMAAGLDTFEDQLQQCAHAAGKGVQHITARIQSDIAKLKGSYEQQKGSVVTKMGKVEQQKIVRASQLTVHP